MAGRPRRIESLKARVGTLEAKLIVPVVTSTDVLATFGRYWRSRTDPKLIASVRKLSNDGIDLLEMGGDDPQGALTYWHERPKVAPRTWTFKTEAELRADWERVERGWIAVDE